MIRSTFIVPVLLITIMHSSIPAMELNEDPCMKWGRQIGGVVSTTLGITVLYCSIKDHVNNGSSLYNKQNLAAAALVIGGLGSFTTKELRIARPVYHPDNGPEEDKEIAQLVMSYRNLGEKTTETVRGSIDISLPLLYAIIQQKTHAKKANELYYNQQKPMLARLPLIGAPIDGILYNPDHWLLYHEMTKNHDDLKELAFSTFIWACIGAYQGIKKSFIQEKTPEDKKFEEWICKDYANIIAQQELYKIWSFMNYKITFNQKNSRKRNIHPIGNLPAELISHIISYLHPDNLSTVDTETNIVHISIPKNKLIQYVLPYMGPLIQIKIEKPGNECGICTQSKVSPTRMHIRYNNCEKLEEVLNEHYQATVARKYGVL